MNQVAKLILLFLCAIVLLVVFIENQPDSVTYDCRLAEISPDIPPEVKEQCRKMHYEEWRRQNPQKGSIINT